MSEMELYSLWCKNAVDDSDLQNELKSIENDQPAIRDRFYRDLEFGTGGLRGVIGAGTNTNWLDKTVKALKDDFRKNHKKFWKGTWQIQKSVI